MRLRTLLLLVVLFCSVRADAQVVAPPPPAKYHVDLRYRIEADRDGRVLRFRAMQAELAALGFVADPRDDADLDILDPTAERLAGVIDSSKLAKLHKVIAVQTVLVRPEGAALPDDLNKPMQIAVRLATGLDANTQRQLHEQAIARLEKLGFVPAVGYADEDFTRVRGTIPAGQVFTLLKDLRGLPAGWLLQETPREKLPMPLRSTLPIRLIEVLPDLEAIAAPILPPAVSPKYASDLRFALADPAFAAKPMRIEGSLNQAIMDQGAFRFQLRSRVPGVLVEGIVGSLVTFDVPTAKDLERLAAQPEVLALRLPPLATNTIKAKASAGDVLGSTRIIELQSRGYRGQGRKVAILAGAFDRAAKSLPANVTFIDLTPELSQSLDPSPVNAAFDGTLAALAAHQAAPEATLLLVRVDPGAFHQLQTVARAVLGDLTLSPAQVARAEVMLAENEDVNRRRDYITAEYTEAFSNLSDDDKPRLRREKAQADLVRLKAEEAAFRVKYDKLAAVRQGLERLAGATAIVNTLVWDDGYPSDGLSELALFLDEKFTPGVRRLAKAPPLPTWVQAASESTWSVWAGSALDRDGDGAMEFADETSPIPKGHWTRELNFLGNLAADGALSESLPAGTKLRLAIQWREPHDPMMTLANEPLIDFTLQLLRQYDPSGKTISSDELAVAAASDGIPVRLMRTASAGVYEQSLEVTLPSAGRYALRVTMASNSARRFGALTRLAEITPKITVRPLNNETPNRIVFQSFVNSRAGVGIAGDSGGAFTVGRCDSQGRSQSLLGAGPGLQLRTKPDALLFGDGSGAAAGTVGGLAAALADLGVRPAQLIGTTAIQPNGMLSLPGEWIQSLPGR